MEDKRVSLKQVVAIGGAFMGFVIGSSFASGQECMQYFTGFGVWKSVGAGLISLLLYVWFVSTIVEDGRYLKLNNSGKIFNFYLGKYLGFALEWFTPIMLFFVYSMMISAAGSTFSEYYGLNGNIGRAIMIIASLATVLLGLNKLVQIIGYISPVLLLEQGYEVHITYRRSAGKAEELMAANPGRLFAHKLDQGKIEEIENADFLVENEWYGVIFNAALGSGTVKEYADQGDPLKAANDVALMTVNALGPLWIYKKMEPVLQAKTEKTKLIFISSVGGGIACFPKFTLSDGMSKCAVAYLAKQLAAENTHTLIDVFCISPGAIETPMFYSSTLKNMSPEERKAFDAAQAKKRLIQPSEIAFWLGELLRKAADRMDLTGYNLHYNKFEGSDEFRSAIAAHWQKVIFGADSDVVLTKDNVATCAGCTVALETLATLLAEPGDVFLIPAPYYSSFVDDINERAGVIAVGVPCDETLDRSAFEAAYERVTAEGRRVRAVLFSSPNNPIGIVYKEDAVRHVIDFAMAHDLEIISDEIYAQTVFDPEAHYVSTLKLVPAGYRHRVHVTSSFAKDFVLSGFRTGMCFSFNPAIIQGFGSITYYSCVSSHTQSLLRALLQSPELEGVMDLSRQRLKTAYEIMTKGLADIGVPTMKAQAGIFIMADFSAYMDKQEFAEEHVLWQKIYNDLMINVSPGQLFGCDRPGWFRMCYAFEEDTVKEACRRLATLKK